MICRNTSIFLDSDQNLTRCYKWSGVTVATDPLLKISFVGAGHPSPAPTNDFQIYVRSSSNSKKIAKPIEESETFTQAYCDL